MTTAIAPRPSAATQSTSTKRRSGKRGVLYLEYDISTPLGPRILAINDLVEELTGYSRETLHGEPFGIIYDPEALDSFLNFLHSKIEQTESFCWVEKNLVKKGGERVPCYWTFAPFRNDRGIQGRKGFVVTLEALRSEQPKPAKSADASQENRVVKQTPAVPAKKTLSVSDAVEESRSESLTIIAGGIAHDFKNILQTIKSTLEMARICSSPSESTLDYLNDAELAIEDAERLARQMMAFSRGYASSMQSSNVSDLLSQAANISTMGTEVTCDLSISGDLWQVFADPRQIYQVFQNILINGCQSMPGGGVLQVSARNALLSKDNDLGLEHGEYVVVGIRDRGCGISPENLSRIFEPEFTTKTNGSGIGLASCQAIVSAHGGRILVDSAVNIGTEFFIFLPTAKTAADCSAQSSPTAARVGNSTVSNRGTAPLEFLNEGARVLVVDDQQNVRKVAEKLLQHLGFETVGVDSGEEALRTYCERLNTSSPIDAVLLDLTLPGGIGGEEVMNEIRKLDEQARIIATSGYFSDESPVSDFLQEGWSGVLAKPYSLDELSETFSDVLAN